MEDRGPVRLVLAVSRAAGLAPYSSPSRLRISRCALVYSYGLHLALGIATLSLLVMGSGAQIAATAYIWSLWLCNIAYLEIIILFAVITAPRKLGDTLFLLKRITKICRTLKCDRIKVSHSRWILISMALMVSATVLMDSGTLFLDITGINYKFAFLTCVMLLFDIKGFFLLLMTMQFVYMANKINCALQGVNDGLKQLYIDLLPRDGLQKTEGNFPTYPKDMISGVQFINVKPKIMLLFNCHTAAARLRSYASAYVSTCNLACKLGDEAGGLLFLLITFSLLNILRGLYYIVLLSGSLGTADLSSVFIFSKSPISCFLHISRIMMLVGPCHDLAEQLENTRFLVSHISCEASSCGDAFRAELNVFFIHLKVNQPCYSALGMFPMGRPLLLTVPKAAWSMEDREPAELVLAVSRAAGLAPYASPSRLRISRCALVYSYALHLILGVASLSVHAIAADVAFDTVGYSWVLWMPNVAYLEIIIWLAVITGPKDLGDTLFLLKHIKKICRSLKEYPTTNTSQRTMRWIFMFMALTVVFTVIMDTQCILLDSTKEYNKVGLLTYGVMLFDLNDLFILVLAMQFVFMAMKINCALQGVNEGLELLYTELYPQDEDERRLRNLQKNEGNFPTYPKDMTSGVHFANVKPKVVESFNYHSAHVRLRLFACAFVSTCDLVRKLGNVSGGLLFQLVTFSILNLLRGIYYVTMLSGSVGAMDLSSIVMFSKAPINSFLHISKIAILVTPCHELAVQLEKTRFLVSHICCEASSSSEAFRAELNVFFIHLKVNQPGYSALGMFSVGRPLLLTIVALVVTYLAVLVGV